MSADDAVEEENIMLCCAICCTNCGLYMDSDCLGCSGKAGVCCLNCEFCFKFSAPMLPCLCCGPKCEADGCSLFNIQCQMCQLIVQGAIPCNKEVPVAVTVLGLTLFPKIGCCMTIGGLKDGSDDYVRSEEMERA